MLRASRITDDESRSRRALVIVQTLVSRGRVGLMRVEQRSLSNRAQNILLPKVLLHTTAGDAVICCGICVYHFALEVQLGFECHFEAILGWHVNGYVGRGRGLSRNWSRSSGSHAR